MNTISEATGFSNGPVSTLPGSRDLLAEGIARCQDHDDRWAQYRVQGETDSMGCEYLYFCASCAEASRIANQEPKDGYCEWHKGEGQNLRPFRDTDEGSAGPVYMTCQSCRDRVNAALRAELDDADRYAPDYDYFPDDGLDDANLDWDTPASFLTNFPLNQMELYQRAVATWSRSKRKYFTVKTTGLHGDFNQGSLWYSGPQDLSAFWRHFEKLQRSPDMRLKKALMGRQRREIIAAICQNSEVLNRLLYGVHGRKSKVAYYQKRQDELRNQLNGDS